MLKTSGTDVLSSKEKNQKNLLYLKWLNQNYLKNFKKTQKIVPRLIDLYSSLQGDFNTRTRKYLRSFCHDGNKFITNGRSEFSTVTNFIVVEKSSPLLGYIPTLTLLRVYPNNLSGKMTPRINSEILYVLQILDN